MNIYELCGYVSGFMFAISLVPQVYKSYKTKQLRDLSIIHQIIFLLGMSLMLIYSIHEDLKPIYIPAACEAFLMFQLFIMKIYYRENEKIIDNDIENP
tara:strand:+ start:604 stop:897 length:294 start_codon:yes stop_codon:yes gene_type:complete